MRQPPIPLKALVLATLLTACAGPAEENAEKADKAEPAARPAVTKPDVLMIVLDDLNDWIGPLGGHPQARTPHLDRLAARGMVFTQAYVPAPLCNPSRSAVLTGRGPASTGIYDNRQPLRLGLPDVVTLPQVFARHGYRTVAAGKVFHDEDPASWQESLDRPPAVLPDERPLNSPPGAEETFDWGPMDVEPGRMPDERLARWLIERLAAPEDTAEPRQPRFLALGLTAPHLPWYLPPAAFEAFPPETVELPPLPPGGDDLADVPAVARQVAMRRDEHEIILAADPDGRTWREAVAAYLAAIAFTDGVVGQVLDALEASPRGRETIVIVWSDHGFHLGEKNHWRKGTLWEESARVPLLMAGPGIAQGRCDRPVSLLDLFPTLLDLAGLPPVPEADGRSFARLLVEPDAPWDHAAVTLKRRDGAVRDQDFRYVLYRDGAEELYDHRSDPHEWHNLAGDPAYAEVKARLAARLPAERAEPAPWEEGRTEDE